LKHNSVYDTRFFFSTAPMPCPYLENQWEKRIVTELIGKSAVKLHDQLSDAGFRRSHNIIYAPVCQSCHACIAVRVQAANFTPSRTQLRVERQNRQLQASIIPAIATPEQYTLFHNYQLFRHQDGEMSKMDYDDYRALVEESPVETSLVEFRKQDETLVAVCLLDHLSNGVSAVYSFFDTGMTKQSLGTYMILWMIRHVQSLSRPYVYLGYWIKDCQNMTYKSSFRPLEMRKPNGWTLMDNSE